MRDNSIIQRIYHSKGGESTEYAARKCTCSLSKQASEFPIGLEEIKKKKKKKKEREKMWALTDTNKSPCTSALKVGRYYKFSASERSKLEIKHILSP